VDLFGLVIDLIQQPYFAFSVSSAPFVFARGNLRLGVIFRLHFVFGVLFAVWCCLESRQVGEPLSRGKGLRDVKSKMPS